MLTILSILVSRGKAKVIKCRLYGFCRNHFTVEFDHQSGFSGENKECEEYEGYDNRDRREYEGDCLVGEQESRDLLIRNSHTSKNKFWDDVEDILDEPNDDMGCRECHEMISNEKTNRRRFNVFERPNK